MLKNELYKDIINDNDFRGFDLLNHLMDKDAEFKEVVMLGLRTGLVRKFNDVEWDKVLNVNFNPNIDEINSFFEMFKEGHNIGNAEGASKLFGKEFYDFDIVYGILPILKDVIVSSKDMEHWWIETDDYIIDTSLLLVMHPLYREKMGYVEEGRILYEDMFDKKKGKKSYV